MRKIIAKLMILTLLLPVPSAWPALSSSDRAEFPGRNLLADGNPGAENGKFGWTVSTGSFSVSTSSPLEGGSSFVWDAGASTETFTSSAVNLPQGWLGQNGVVSCRFQCASGTCSHSLIAFDGTNNLVSKTITSSTTGAPRTTANFIFPSSGSVKLRVTANANEPSLKIDSCIIGLADDINLSQVSQAQFMGAVVITGCAADWSTTSTSFADPSTQASCSYAVSGQASAPATNLPAIKFANGLPPGDYVLQYEGLLHQNSAAGGKSAYFQFTDGTNTAREVSEMFNSAASSTMIPGFNQSISYATAQGSTTLKIQMKATSSGSAAISGTSADPGVIKVYRYPSQTDTLFGPNVPLQPTSQVFTSGSSATYTRPYGVSRIEIDAWGGGGGGAPSGTSAGGAVGDGVASTFICSGVTVVTAPGGSKGIHGGNGGAGGVAPTITAPAVDFGSYAGTGGGPAQAQGATLTAASPSVLAGGFGGGRGGGLGDGTTGGGGAAIANTGGGGGGAAATAVNNNNAGSGGGGGSHAVASLSAPPSTCTYTVGTGGAGGTLGTSGAAGAAGAAGKISVREYYGAQNAPLLIQGVTAPQNTTGSTTINNWVTKSANYTATANDETIVFTADATLTLPAAASFQGKKYHVISSGSGTDVTIDPNASETVCGATTILLAGTEGIQIQSDGTNWLGLAGGCVVTRRAVLNCDSGSAITSQGGSDWISSIGNISTGTCTITLATGPFSATPNCTATNVDTSVMTSLVAIQPASATSLSMRAINSSTTSASSAYDATILCQGLR